MSEKTARRNRRTQKLACRSINPFIRYYWQLRDSLGGYYSSQMIGKIAAYRWKFMRYHDKLPYIQAAKQQLLRRRRAARSRKYWLVIYFSPYKYNKIVVRNHLWRELSFDYPENWWWKETYYIEFLVANIISKNLYFIINRLFKRTKKKRVLYALLLTYMIKVNCKKSISLYAIASISSNFLRSESDIDLTSVSPIRSLS